MKEVNRVLAYEKALAISNEELLNIVGGAIKWSVTPTQQLSGYYPGPTDVILDQQWD